MGRAVAVGRIVRAHGVRGEVALERFGDSEEVLEPGRRFDAKRGEAAMTLVLTEVRPASGAGRWLARFEGVGDRDTAERLRGFTLFLDESELPPPEEGSFYRYQLIGLKARTEDGETLGTVEEVWETGANDVYVVRGERGEILLPAVAAVIEKIDPEAGEMVVHLIPGLLPEES